jgi:transcriptional regulator with XRE-family HTH domain
MTMASQIRHYRRRHRMSAQQLADRTGELGMPIARSVLANLESGRRGTVSVPEMLIFAQALDIAPADLLIPPDGLEILPGVTWSRKEALRWLITPPCERCGGIPPEGFTCDTCGRSGSGQVVA